VSKSRPEARLANLVALALPMSPQPRHLPLLPNTNPHKKKPKQKKKQNKKKKRRKRENRKKEIKKTIIK
jgi:hypothetical protein